MACSRAKAGVFLIATKSFGARGNPHEHGKNTHKSPVAPGGKTLDNC